MLQASFLREDLPYFAELLAEVVSMTRYTSKFGVESLLAGPAADASQPTSFTKR